MANVPYDPEASVQPDARPPDDYVRVQANPSQFGGLIAQGGEQLGKGATDAAQHWGVLQTNDASNNFQHEASQIAEQYKQLNGADALHARDEHLQKVEDAYDKYKNQLGSVDQVNKFESDNRSYTDRFIIGGMNTWANEQGRQYRTTVNNASLTNANNMAATAGSNGDGPSIMAAYKRAQTAVGQEARDRGLEASPEVMQDLRTRASSALASGAQAWGLKDPVKALDFVKRNENAFEPNTYKDLIKQLGSSNNRNVGDQAANKTLAQATEDFNSGKAQVAGDKSYFDAVRQAESGGNDSAVSHNPATGAPIAYGRYQFTAGTWRGLANAHPELGLTGENILNPDKQEAAMRAFTNDNANVLRAQGIAPSAGNLYMTAFLGAGGGPSFLKALQQNPTGNAAALFPKEAQANPSIFYSRGGDGRSLQQVYALMTAKVGGAAPPSGQAVPAQQPIVAANNPIVPSNSPTVETPGSAPPIENASFAPPQTPQPEASSGAAPSEQTTATSTQSAPPQMSPEEIAEGVFARQMSLIAQMPEDTEDQRDQKERAFGKAERDYKVRQIETQQDAHAKALQKAAALDEYNGRLHGGDNPSKIYSDVWANPNLTSTEKMQIGEAIERKTGQRDPASYSPAYHQILGQIVASYNDPSKTMTETDLWKMQAQGLISDRDHKDLSQAIAAPNKQKDEQGTQTQIHTMLEFGSNRLSKIPGTNIKIPGGDEKAAMFTMAFYNQWNNFRNSDEYRKNGDAVFPLFDVKEVEKLADSLTTPTQLRNAQQNALLEASGKPSLPPVPANVPNDEAWQRTVSAPPQTEGGQRSTTEQWGNAISLLVQNANNPKYIQTWDKLFANTNYRAMDVLNGLGVRFTPPPNYTPPPTPEQKAAEFQRRFPTTDMLP